jgi:hypothetical protein
VDSCRSGAVLQQYSTSFGWVDSLKLSSRKWVRGLLKEADGIGTSVENESKCWLPGNGWRKSRHFIEVLCSIVHATALLYARHQLGAKRSRSDQIVDSTTG